MLDLLGDVNVNLTATYLESACGNGNFLVAILERKLKLAAEMKGYAKQPEIEFMILQGLAAIHGIDICQENVLEARLRMKADIVGFLSETFNTWKVEAPFWAAVDIVLATNIQAGDMLNGTADLVITEWKAPKPLHFSRNLFAMDDMLRHHEIDEEAKAIAAARERGETLQRKHKPVLPVKIIKAQHYRKLKA